MSCMGKGSKPVKCSQCGRRTGAGYSCCKKCRTKQASTATVCNSVTITNVACTPNRQMRTHYAVNNQSLKNGSFYVSYGKSGFDKYSLGDFQGTVSRLPSGLKLYNPKDVREVMED